MLSLTPNRSFGEISRSGTSRGCGSKRYGRAAHQPQYSVNALGIDMPPTLLAVVDEVIE
jgi:hypothetical protein